MYIAKEKVMETYPRAECKMVIVNGKELYRIVDKTLPRKAQNLSALKLNQSEAWDYALARINN